MDRLYAIRTAYVDVCFEDFVVLMALCFHLCDVLVWLLNLAVGHVSVPSHPTPSKGGKRKLANDPNRPKRPTSAYFYFVQIEREEAAKRGEKITRVRYRDGVMFFLEYLFRF